jgi:hypothetical protein
MSGLCRFALQPRTRLSQVVDHGNEEHYLATVNATAELVPKVLRRQSPRQFSLSPTLIMVVGEPSDVADRANRLVATVPFPTISVN